MGRLVSTLAMVAGAGRAGRLHLLRRRRQLDRQRDRRKEKAFGTVASDDIEEVRIALNEGEAGAR